MKKIILSAAMVVASVAMASAQITWGVKGGYNLSNYSISAKGLTAEIEPGFKPGFYAGGVGNFMFSENFGLQFELTYSMDGTRLGVSKDFMKDFLIPTITESLDPNDSFDAMISGIISQYDKSATAAVTFHHINIPVMLKFQPVGGLSVMAGPWVNFTVANSVRLNKDLKDFIKPTLAGMNIKYDDVIDYANDVIKDNTNKFNFGLAFGAEYAFCNGIFIDARYDISLLNTLKKDYKVRKGVFNQDEEIKGNWKKDRGVEPTLKGQAFQLGLGYRF